MIDRQTRMLKICLYKWLIVSLQRGTAAWRHGWEAFKSFTLWVIIYQCGMMAVWNFEPPVTVMGGGGGLNDWFTLWSGEETDCGFIDFQDVVFEDLLKCFIVLIEWLFISLEWWQFETLNHLSWGGGWMIDWHLWSGEKAVCWFVGCQDVVFEELLKVWLVEWSIIRLEWGRGGLPGDGWAGQSCGRRVRPGRLPLHREPVGGGRRPAHHFPVYPGRRQHLSPSPGQIHRFWGEHLKLSLSIPHRHSKFFFPQQKVLPETGIRIRIHFIDPDPIRIQGFCNQKLKKFTAEILLYIKNYSTIYLSLGLNKSHPSYKRSFQLSKENIQHFKHEIS